MVATRLLAGSASTYSINMPAKKSVHFAPTLESIRLVSPPLAATTKAALWHSNQNVLQNKMALRRQRLRQERRLMQLEDLARKRNRQQELIRQRQQQSVVSRSLTVIRKWNKFKRMSSKSLSYYSQTWWSNVESAAFMMAALMMMVGQHSVPLVLLLASSSLSLWHVAPK